MVSLAYGTHNACCASGCNAKRHTSLLYVRARDVKLDSWYIVESVYAGGTLGIIVWRRTAYVDNHIGVDILNLRIDVLAEVVYTLVLQTYAVEHTLGCFCHTWVVVALSWIERGTLDDDAADAVEWHKVGKLQTISECSRCGHYGILQLQTAYFNA